MADKKSFDKNKSLSNTKQIELFQKLMELEEKKVAVDMQREKNISKELEYSASSSEEATKIALADIKSAQGIHEDDNKIKKRVSSYIFIFLIFVLAAVIVLGYGNVGLAEKLFKGLIDLGKIALGVAVGIFYQKSKK